MVKLVFLCRRRPDITHEHYAALLVEGHIPLALRHHPLMRRYVVNVVEEAHAGAPALDSIGCLWFDSLADYRDRLCDSAEGARIIARDVAGFLGSADAYATSEQVIVPSHGTHTIVCLAGTSRDAWPSPHLGPRGYVASVVTQRLSATGPAYDAFAEVPDAPDIALTAHAGVASIACAYRVRAYVAK